MPMKDQVHRLVIHMAATSMIHMPLILVIILKMRLIPQSTLAVLTIVLHIPILQHLPCLLLQTEEAILVRRVTEQEKEDKMVVRRSNSCIQHLP